MGKKQKQKQKLRNKIMSPIDITQFNVKEGNLNFEIRVGQINWQNPLPLQLVRVGRVGSFISLIKNGSKLTYSHFDVETGEKNDIEVDVSTLVNERSYAFVLSWSSSENIMRIFIDGDLKGEKSLITSSEESVKLEA